MEITLTQIAVAAELKRRRLNLGLHSDRIWYDGPVFDLIATKARKDLGRGSLVMDDDDEYYAKCSEIVRQAQIRMLARGYSKELTHNLRRYGR